MNYGRLVGAAVAATVYDSVYGFLVYGVLLANEFAPIRRCSDRRRPAPRICRACSCVFSSPSSPR
jgi:hypothetical protein